jgi:hypothetical protein
MGGISSFLRVFVHFGKPCGLVGRSALMGGAISGSAAWPINSFRTRSATF